MRFIGSPSPLHLPQRWRFISLSSLWCMGATGWIVFTLWIGVTLMSINPNETASSSSWTITTDEKILQGQLQHHHGHSTSEIRSIITSTTTTKYAPPPGTCGQIYFWGGGKSGSTTLFFTLTRGPGGGGAGRHVSKNTTNNNTGPISIRDLNFGKEPCYGESKWKNWVDATMNNTLCMKQLLPTNNNNNDPNVMMQRTHIMNGCPRNTVTKHANVIMDLRGSEYTTFLMLIRDPVERLVSDLNDQVHRQSRSINVEKYAKIMARSSSHGQGGRGVLSYQGLALQTLLSIVKDPRRILIIPMESMTINMQGVIDDVMDHVGGARWTINATSKIRMNNGKTRGPNKQYATLTNATRDALRETFRKDVILLESLVGKSFSWSSWATTTTTTHENSEQVTNNGGEEEQRKGWLTTIPNPKRNVQGGASSSGLNYGKNGQKVAVQRGKSKFWQKHQSKERIPHGTYEHEKI